MLDGKAGLVEERGESYVGRERQIPFLFTRREGRRLPYVGAVRSDGLCRLVGLDTAFSTAGEDWMSRVRAGETFNRMVAATNMRGYWAVAQAKAAGTVKPMCGGPRRPFDYVVPGRVPSEEDATIVYRAVVDKIRGSGVEHEAIVRAYLASYVLKALEKASPRAKGG